MVTAGASRVSLTGRPRPKSRSRRAARWTIRIRASRKSSAPSPAWSIFAGPHRDSLSSRRIRTLSSLTELRWRTTVPSSRPAGSTNFWNRIAATRCGAPPTASATSAIIRQHRRSAPDLAEAVRRAVSQLRELFPEASLNALVLGEGQLIAVHAHARSYLPDEDVAEITAADLPTEHLETTSVCGGPAPTRTRSWSGRPASATWIGNRWRRRASRRSR